MEIKKKYVAQMLAVAFAVLMAIPTLGMLTAQAASPTELVLVDSTQINIKDLQNLGAEIFVDYGNGRYLMKVPTSGLSSLSAIGVDLKPIANSRELDLYPSAYKFNPAKGLPSIPSKLMMTYNPGEQGEYIVQFVGPVKSEWVNKVRNAGAIVYRDVQKYGIVVKMTPETAATVRNMPEVAWVGVYEPAYKIPANVDINSDNNYLISVAAYKGVSTKNLADELSNLGITVIFIMDRNVIISTPGTMLPEIAKLSGIEEMGIYSPPKPLDLHADRIIHARELWYPDYNGLGDKFIGWGQVVGIQDTGFDNGQSKDHPSDNDHIQGPLGNRVVRYKDQGGASDPDGNNDGVAHGSHCCGLIAGNGYSWEKQFGYDVNDYNWDHAESVGVAPGAKLSADGIMASSGSSGAGLQPSTNYWDTEQNDGAQIYSNSWGTSPGDYDSTYSKAVDDKSNSDNRRLFVFAAGNDGPARDTLNPDSQGKNGLCVAASENFRPGEFIGGNSPNYIADFSSRGGTLSDSRIKPDIAAVGTVDISLNAKGEYDFDTGSNGPGPDPSWIKGVDQYDWDNEKVQPDGKPDYQYMDGTSMATPVVAGSAAVVRQFLVNTSYSSDPTSQIVKALLINGARRLPNLMYPGYDQGWGLVDLKNSLIPDPPTIVQYTEGTMSSTGTWDAASDGGLHLDVESGEVPLKVTLVWIDTSGKDLNRNLDLYVEAPDGTWYHGNAYGQDGWTMPETTVENSADQFIGDWDHGSGYDEVNNVEQVEVKNPIAGTWTIHVIGANVPSATPFALVVRADIGSLQKDYAVKMDVGHDKIIRVDKGGSVTLPVTITNYGTKADTIQLGDNLPSGLSSSYTYGGVVKNSFALNPRESATVLMTITADSNASPGVYDFSITGSSQHDINVKAITDMQIEVIDQSVKIPRFVKVASTDADEMYPSVTTFTDHNGIPWIFVAYIQPFPVSSDAKFGGNAVMVKYAQLGQDGMPETWHGPIRLTTLNEYPNDLRLTHATNSSSDPYQDRVWVVWTGDDPNATHDPGKGSKGSWGRIAWADNSDYSSWVCPATGHNTTIDENYGSQTYNSKRVNSIQYRPSEHQLLYVFEHLDSDGTQIKAVHDGYTTSTDGGSTWASAADSDPGGDYFFFPNIMDGGNDYNDVVWMYVYHRASSGNDRDLSCQVYDGSWGGDSGGATKDTDVLDNPNNLMFPVVAYDKSSGSTNRVFFAVLNDTSGAYQINVGYHEGAVSSSNPPPDTNNAWGTVKGPFATSVSDGDYSTRPILNMISTPDDVGMWVQYMEKSTPLGINIRAIYSNDQFNTVKYYDITANGYVKGHQMSSSVKIGNTDYVYTVYHMSSGSYEDTNYDVYVSVYHAGWENDPDVEAPAILRPLVTPADYNNGMYYVNLTTNPSFEIAATIDDSDHGRSNIASAYWMEGDANADPSSLDWSNAKSMTLDGNTAIEKASVVMSPSWCKDTTHTIWMKATDSAGNVQYSKVTIYVVAPPQVTVSLSQGWNLISLPWLTSPTSITDALSGVSWTRAMVYIDGQWHTYDKNRDAKYNLGFPLVDNTMGIWVDVSSATNFTHDICGISTTTITLHKGWNLVGYVSQTTRTVSDAMASFTGSYDYVQTYDGNSIVDASQMELGHAYWIHVTSEGSWSIDW